MNAQNAKNAGEERGKRFLRHNPEISKQDYESHGRTIAQMETRRIGTQDLFIEGWNSRWRDPEPVKVIPHNPTSRFCMCEECMMRV